MQSKHHFDGRQTKQAEGTLTEDSKESWKKGLTIKRKRDACLSTRETAQDSNYKMEMSKSNKDRNGKYLCRRRKYNIKILRCIKIAKDTCQKLKKILITRMFCSAPPRVEILTVFTIVDVVTNIFVENYNLGCVQCCKLINAIWISSFV